MAKGKTRCISERNGGAMALILVAVIQGILTGGDTP